MSWVLGLAASHNGAAALYRDRTLVAAIQEERLSRVKRDVLRLAHPSRAVDALLAAEGLDPDDIDLVVGAPLASPHEPDQRLELHPTLGHRPHRSIGHHHAHALSAYACSGYEHATALIADGMGSFARDLSARERAAVIGPDHGGNARETVSIYTCDAAAAVPVEKHLGRTGFAPGVTPTPFGPFSSLGLMYQQVARASFGSWDAAGKVMGLAPLGRATFARDLFYEIAPDGRLEFQDDLAGIAGLVGAPRPYPADEGLHRDLAASVQAALEEGLMQLVRRARRCTRSSRLVCAGGVFLNSVANELIVRSGLFDEVFFLPFAEDSGTAVGAAFFGVRQLHGPTVGARLQADALGPPPTDHDAAIALAEASGARRVESSPAVVAERLVAGQAVGFFNGRSELGPRALGQRSILFDPRRPRGRRELNRVKGREPFRPFAPAVLREEASAWFELGDVSDSPFMLRVAPVVASRREAVPAITHVDGSARVQTVDGGPLAEVIRAFASCTGVPLVLNTSFNRAGEPLVETARDAVVAFGAMGLDALWLDGVLLARGEQSP